jgi:hypothetical protein
LLRESLSNDYKFQNQLSGIEYKTAPMDDKSIDAVFSFFGERATLQPFVLRTLHLEGVSKVNFATDGLTVYNFTHPRIPKADLYSM